MGAQGRRVVIWEKTCSCLPATATTGEMTWVIEPSDQGQAMRITYHIGPVCDVCRIPWNAVPLEGE